MWSKTRKNQQGFGEDGEEQWGSTGSREEHKDLRANQGSGRGRSKVPPTRLPARAWPSQWRLPKPQPLARFPQAQGLTLQARLLLTPPAPPRPLWLSGSAAVLAAGGPGDNAPSSPPPCLPTPALLPAAAVITSSEISIGAQGAGPRCGAERGLGRGEWEE